MILFFPLVAYVCHRRGEQTQWHFPDTRSMWTTLLSTAHQINALDVNIGRENITKIIARSLVYSQRGEAFRVILDSLHLSFHSSASRIAFLIIHTKYITRALALHLFICILFFSPVGLRTSFSLPPLSHNNHPL